MRDCRTLCQEDCEQGSNCSIHNSRKDDISPLVKQVVTVLLISFMMTVLILLSI
ncbi:MAG: hypothetical protein UT21_C0010G0007 [Candidatus Woesebacteria bacterium GW2011_GWA1_39_11b]|nr:MAG: hypothetical protein UT21_C0010G0007 [Candidatus Woesebacteria bacterium GW2011_GWA1_39_11b]